MLGKSRMVVVTTDRRGVFFGQLTRNDEDRKIVELINAQMAVYWSEETHGVLGLASIGPQKGSKISPIVPKIILDGVTLIMDCSQEAVEQWKKQMWGLSYGSESRNGMYQTTKTGIAICPFFIWQSENVEGLGQRETDVNLTFCTHPANPDSYEGNCNEKNCPLIKQEQKGKDT